MSVPGFGLGDRGVGLPPHFYESIEGHSNASASMRMPPARLATAHDNDYYRRICLQGWRTEEFGGHRVRHAASQTQASDPRISAEVAAGWEWHGRP